MASFYHTFSAKSPLPSKTFSLESGIKISQSEYKVFINLPFPSADSLFYKTSGDGILVSNDIRLLYNNGDKFDKAGIISLLLLGAAVPPLTPFKEIKSFLPGFKYEINMQTLELIPRLSCQWSPVLYDDKNLEIDHQVRILSDSLDRVIRTLCPTEDPIVLFSGGVDSSVLASRISLMGWRRATLFHCSFGKADRETDIARSIATEIDMPISVVMWKDFDGFESLEKAANLYRFPFCDQSCVPTHAITKALVSYYGSSRVVFDGTGADGAFGLFRKASQASKLYRIPMVIRQFIGAQYITLGFWRKANFLEPYFRLIRRSAFLSELPFSIAHNVLCDIGFDAAPDDIDYISSLCQDWIHKISRSRDPKETYPLMDLGLVCAGIFAQKNRSPLLDRSFMVNYPFLQHEIVDLALSRARFWPGNEVPKNALKYLLAKTVSPKFVFRRKSAFNAPGDEQFSHPIFLQYLDAAINVHSPLSDFVNRKLLVRLIGDVSAKRRLPRQTYDFLWAIAFCHAWLSQLGSVHELLKKHARRDTSSGG
jgi:hypothetical protein